MVKNYRGFALIPVLVLVLAILGVVLGIYLSQNPQILRPKAFEEDFLKKDFLSAVSDLENRIGQQAIDTEAKGRLIKIHQDEFEGENPESKEFFSLVTNEGLDSSKVYEVSFIGEQPSGGFEQEVTLKGKSVGSYLVVDGDLISEEIRGFSSKFIERKIPTVGNSNKIAVVFVKFSNSSSFSPDTLRPTLYDSNKSLAAYFTEVSYGKFSLTKDNFTFFTNSGSWYTFPEPEPAGAVDCWRQISKASYSAKGLIGNATLQPFQHIMYVYPQIKGCSPASGFGDNTPGDRLESWVFTGSTDSFAYIHEFAHNLGLGHANGLNCGSNVIDTASACKIDAYADWYDPMGGSIFRFDGLKHKPYHLNAAHKQALGWLEVGKEVIEHTTGTKEYLIYPVSKPLVEGEIKAVKIKRFLDNGKFEYYYLDSRGRMGFDELLWSPPFSDYCTYPLDGLGIHLWDGIPRSDTKLVLPQREYIRPSLCPETDFWGDSLRIFTDNTYGNDIQIKVITGAHNQYRSGDAKPVRLTVSVNSQSACERVKGKCADSKGVNSKLGLECDPNSFRSDVSYNEGGCQDDQYPYCYTDCRPR